MLMVVGGHSRNIGKTSVVCEIIRSLVDRQWTAIKVTQYGHGVCSHEGEPCECADPMHPVALSRETGADPQSDSGRFLTAGAIESYWARTAAGNLGEAMPRIGKILKSGGNVIVESNSILQFAKPDLCVMVVDGAVMDFKDSSLRFLDRASAIVATSDARFAWPNVSAALLARKRVIHAPAPEYRSSELIELIQSKCPANVT